MKRPWNIAENQVYSLATYADGEVNMNICTYVSVASKIPRLYSIAVDYKTRTFHNLQKNPTAVLQFLGTENIKLVAHLGRKSGFSFNKHRYLEKNDALCSWKQYEVLRHACAYVELKKTDQVNIGGDHELYIFRIEGSRTNQENHLLGFQELIRSGIIL